VGSYQKTSVAKLQNNTGLFDANNVCLGIVHHLERLALVIPLGLKLTKFILTDQSVAVADVYDAMRSRRSYKKLAPHEEVMNFFN